MRENDRLGDESRGGNIWKSLWKRQRAQGLDRSDPSSPNDLFLQSPASSSLPHMAAEDGRGHVSLPADNTCPTSEASSSKEVILVSDNGALEFGASPLKSLWPPKGRRRTTYIIIAVMTPLLILTVLLSVLLTRSHSHPLSVEKREGPVVELGYSNYKGTHLSNGVDQWLGIRFAAPPVGDLRFRAPQDPQATNSLQDASKFGLKCLATGAVNTTTTANSTSEDCLFLNVFAPTQDPTSYRLLPVYIFIGGGGFNQDSDVNFNASNLILSSDYNVVVVNFNYRVGPYGFLTSKEIVENGDLNVGLLDQRKVMHWVQEHIHLFGGDPNHVVIGGDSAGGGSIDLHLSAYGGRDDHLFHAAAGESPSYATQLTVDQAQYQYDALVERVGCNSTKDSLACLRALPIQKLQGANINIPTPGGGPGAPLYMYSTVIDGDFSRNFTYAEFENGNFVKVPVIFGDPTNDGTQFVYKNTSSYDTMNIFLKDQFTLLDKTMLETIDSLYPKAEQFPNSSAYWRTASNAYGEMRYVCPGMKMSDMYYKYNVTQTWNYRFNVIDPTDAASGIGVGHVKEIYMIWGPNNTFTQNAPVSYATKLNAPEIPVVRAYWLSFIRAYDPNVYRKPGSPRWETWTSEKKQRILLQTNVTKMEDVPSDQLKRCAYLSSIGLSIQQ